MGLTREQAVPYLAAAFRETFEESGIWLGEGQPPPAARDALNRAGGARGRRSAPEERTTLAHVLDQHQVSADLDLLQPWSWWVTPRQEPRRYDTRFFVAFVDTDEGLHDAGETVASAWLPLHTAVERAEAGELPMAPPTWWTLRELAELGTRSAIQARGAPQAAICPILEGGPESLRLVLPGHPAHPDQAIAGLPSEIRFVQGRWWANQRENG